MPEAETPPPVPVPAPAGDSPPAPADSTGLPSNVAAAIATFFPLLGGVIFLVLEKKDRFVRFYAMQSVFMGGLLVALALALGLAEVIFRQIPLIGWLIAFAFALVNLLFSLAWLVVWVIAIVKALTSVEWEVPVLGRYVRKYLENSSAGASEA